MDIKNAALDELDKARNSSKHSDDIKKIKTPDLTTGLENSELFTESDREKLILELQTNKLSDTAFSDPYTENTRKIRRNLLLASVSCLVASTLELKISSIVGVSTGNDNIPIDSLLGLFSVGIAYYLLAFISFILIDLYAWKIETEIVRLQPYNKFLDQIEKRLGHLQSTTDFYQKIIRKPINSFYREDNIEEKKQFTEMHNYLTNNLSDLTKINQEMITNIYPFLEDTRRISKIIGFANLRFVFRILALLIIDILLPVALGIVAFLHSVPHLPDFINTFWTKL